MTVHVSEILSMLNESLFRAGEKQRLKSLKNHGKQRDASSHRDLLSEIHDAPNKSIHQKRIEHNGTVFWSYYFEGEHPEVDTSLPDYLNKAWDEQLKIQSCTIDPPLTQVVPELDGLGEDDKSICRRWVQYYTVAQTAWQENNFEDSAANFRSAYKQTQKLDNKRSRKTALSAKGLADSLTKLGQNEEADTYYELALAIDEELLGYGDDNLEAEFYEIARHFVDEGKFQEMEKTLRDLQGRLRMSVGLNDPLMARCLNELGLIYCKKFDWISAETLFERAIAILKGMDPLPRKQLAAVHNNYAALCESCDRTDEAREHYQTAVDILQAA